KLPRKEWDHFDLGTLAHGVLERFHENLRSDKDMGGTNLKRLMKESFKQQKNLMEKKKPIAPEILLGARDMLQEYLEKILDNGIGSEILSLESEFNIRLNERYSVKGFIDRIDKDRDSVFHIKDY
ncbi:MAG: PD-(D/E)XK nuclease family protein, partial [Planctomycetota bacterium]